MSFEHQDWKPVVIKKTKLSPSTSSSSSASSSASASASISVSKIKEEDDIKKPIMVDHELSLTIQKFRVQKGLTQKQLAQALNLPVQIISDYEKGSCVKNSLIVSKIKTYLGITKHNSK